jgi:hypothetical protein
MRVGYADRRQRLVRRLALRQDVVVLCGREVASTLDVAASEVSSRRVVEPTPASREHARVIDQV